MASQKSSPHFPSFIIFSFLSVALISATVLIFILHRTAPTPTPPAISPTNTISWQTCVNTELHFSIRYPPDFQFDKNSCFYFPEYQLIMHNTDEFKKGYVITITANQTIFSPKEWIIQLDLCPQSTGSPLCAPLQPGPLPDSIQVTALNRHYAGIDTLVKYQDTLYDIGISAREPNTPISQPAANLYNRILSTFKFINTSPKSENKFCGGIAGVSCPEGFTCKYDGNYPDAGGTCIPNPASSQTNCKISGCNQEICHDSNIMIKSVCLNKPEYACLKYAICEKQAGGKCDWTQTPKYLSCLKNLSQ